MKSIHKSARLLCLLLLTITGRIWAQAPCNNLSATPSSNQNYIRTLVPRKPFTNADSLALKKSCEVMESIQYFDGLGRPLQTVTVKGNPDATKDVVQPFTYDQFGREVKKYLPYTTETGTVGSYRSDALTTGQSGFYNSGGTSGQQQTNGIVTITNPFAETRIEASPLNRPIEQGAPGANWAIGQRTVGIAYTFNDAASVDFTAGTGYTARLYVAAVNTNGSRTLSTGGNYAHGELYVTVTHDENYSGSGKIGTTEEYKDKQGHVVLKRTFNHNTATSANEVLSTYYVYDDFGNLAFVLPPGANPDAGLSTAANQTTLNNLCYQYHYDNRNRVIEKKLPGKGWDFMVYNRLDQVVMTQDSNERSQNPQIYNFIKYDIQGRVIITGIHTTGASAGANVRTYYQGLADSWGPKMWEDRTSSGVGYTNNAQPNGGTQNTTVNYYDDYTAPGIPSAYSIPTGAVTTPRGLPTAGYVAVLGSDGHISTDLLWRVIYYDAKGRVIKNYKQHDINAGASYSTANYDEYTHNYDFTNNDTLSVRIHHTLVSGVSKSLTITKQYEFDHMGRKRRSWQQIGSGTNTLVSQTNYNEVGQLRTKQLGSTDGTTFLQTIGYNYNERGWLRHAGSASNLFNVELRYNDSTDVGVTKAYNGNISQMLYHGLGSGNKTFQYTYDDINRLTWAQSTGGTLDEKISYDAMGNISQLIRGGTGKGTLNYTVYTGNQLNTVTGYSARTYAYDGNGNVTGTGLGKTIDYNMLNLPRRISQSGTALTNYYYDANGNKTRRTGGGGNWDYIDGIVYYQGNISFINTDEGRAVPNGSTYTYEYNLQDHLGNTRVSFYSNSGTLTTLQEDEYYSFGLRSGVSDNSNGNRYLYNGKEVQFDLADQYDYGARFYDPVIARWGSIDPLAEISRRWSPYAYAQNNPVRNIDIDGMVTIDGGYGTTTDISANDHWSIDGDVLYNHQIYSTNSFNNLRLQTSPNPRVNTIVTSEEDEYGRLEVTQTTTTTTNTKNGSIVVVVSASDEISSDPTVTTTHSRVTTTVTTITYIQGSKLTDPVTTSEDRDKSKVDFSPLKDVSNYLENFRNKNGVQFNDAVADKGKGALNSAINGAQVGLGFGESTLGKFLDFIGVRDFFLGPHIDEQTNSRGGRPKIILIINNGEVKHDLRPQPQN